MTLNAKRNALVALGVALVIGPDGKLPTEVRVFKAGVNDTEKGPYLFDDEAARLVMAHQEAMGGVDRMIDLEHLSLDEESENYDPDARGWCRLAVRAGELWLVGISWTPDGTERLTSRKQRYLSPAFPTDEDRRITKIVNIALTAIPATHDAVALIAASTRGTTMHPKILALLARLALLNAQAAKLEVVRLAEGDGPAKGKAAACKESLAKCAEACSAAEKAFSGKDIDAAFTAMDIALSAMDECEKACAAMSGGAAPAPSEPTSTAVEGEPAMMRALAIATGKADPKEAIAEVTRLRAVAVEHEAEIQRLAAQQKVIDDGERRALVGELVKLGHETPATAWEDEKGTVPAEPWASMKLESLRSRVEKLTGTKPVPGAVRPPPSLDPATQSNRINIDENEVNRLRATHARETQGVPEARRRKFDDVLASYRRVREAQLAGAETEGASREHLRRLSAGVKAANVLTTPQGDLVTLAQTPIQPIQQFGMSSQRALEEFRLEFNTTLVSSPVPWSEQLGVLLPGGSLKDTYPLVFYAIKYRELGAQNPEATNPNSVDVSVQKKQFAAAATAQLLRLMKGDFAYIQAWGTNAAQMARARVNLRNELVTALLEGGTAGYWGQTKDQPTGIDGQPFFSATHKVNPFDPKMKYLGSATWSNYQSAATPLNANNLTAEKASFLKVPGPDGQSLASRATGLLNPTTLDEAARLLLTVQDIILQDSAAKDASAAVRNEHFQSGFEHIWGPQLAGTDATANYYLFSRETIGRGLPPWVLAEDSAEEVRVWDESSDFYKDSGFIKIGSYVFCNAALLYPQGIRLVKGA